MRPSMLVLLCLLGGALAASHIRFPRRRSTTTTSTTTEISTDSTVEDEDVLTTVVTTTTKKPHRFTARFGQRSRSRGRARHQNSHGVPPTTEASVPEPTATPSARKMEYERNQMLLLAQKRAPFLNAVPVPVPQEPIKGTTEISETEKAIKFRPQPFFKKYQEDLEELESSETVLEPVQVPLSVANQKGDRVAVSKNYMPHEFELERNKAAKYQFETDIEDNIYDSTHQRSESRDGLAVKGMYSYSDGYFKRTVHYEADEKGYRIVKMEAEPLEGPMIDLSGTASVRNQYQGTALSYSVQSRPEDVPKALVLNLFE